MEQFSIERNGRETYNYEWMQKGQMSTMMRSFEALQCIIVKNLVSFMQTFTKTFFKV